MMVSLTTQAQTVFHEDFGNEPGRVITKYLPTEYSYKFADTVGVSAYSSTPYSIPQDTLNKVIIDNGHYAVVPIQNINKGFLNSNNFGWMWTGPSAYSANPNWGGQPYTTVLDASTTYGDTGAVMVVNAGFNALIGETEDDGHKPLYVRSVRLEPNTTYKISYKYYIVNSGSNIRLAIRDGISYGESYNKDMISSDYARSDNGSSAWASSSDGVWTTHELIFTTRDECMSKNYEILLFNINSGTSNNDYYIDEIILEQVSETGILLSVVRLWVKVFLAQSLMKLSTLI